VLLKLLSSGVLNNFSFKLDIKHIDGLFKASGLCDHDDKGTMLLTYVDSYLPKVIHHLPGIS
jgi:hypothetical protein